MTAQLCSREGCDHPARARGLCKACYETARRQRARAGLNGWTPPVWLARTAPIDHCTYRDCYRPVTARNLCSGHYQRLRGRIDPSKPLKAPNRRKWTRAELVAEVQWFADMVAIDNPARFAATLGYQPDALRVRLERAGHPELAAIFVHAAGQGRRAA